MPTSHRRSVLLGGALAGLAAPAAARTLSAACNAEVVRRYFEDVWNRGRLEVLDELLSRSYINHTPSLPDPPPGPAGLTPIVAAVRRGFPDLHYAIEDVIATDDRAVARVVMTGTHWGDLFGLAPTGRVVRVGQINIEEIGPDGLIHDHWRLTDELSLMRQLGRVA